MSDFGRKNFTQKASEAVKPNSEKTYAEQTKEKATGLADSIGKTVQPESQKSYGQKASDTLGNKKDEAQDSGKTVLDTAGEYVEAA
ncbi:lipid-binding protein HSP12 ASCRUDRAFT_77108, partial [Ascoidea rubescens DSM 1968]